MEKSIRSLYATKNPTLVYSNGTDVAQKDIGIILVEVRIMQTGTCAVYRRYEENHALLQPAVSGHTTTCFDNDTI